MGNLATPEFLIARWDELCRDPSLRNLPYKIELNASGKIEMSPASNRHGRLQGELAYQLRSQLLDGQVISECSIFTRIGIRVADMAWASHEFMAAFGEITPYMRAPEICVEIASPSNPKGEVEEKTQAYLAAGAREAWIVGEDGSIRYFSSVGELPKSGFPVAISLPPPIK
jgi:Uma2 family endonuclease